MSAMSTLSGVGGQVSHSTGRCFVSQ